VRLILRSPKRRLLLVHAVCALSDLWPIQFDPCFENARIGFTTPALVLYPGHFPSFQVESKRTDDHRSSGVSHTWVLDCVNPFTMAVVEHGSAPRKIFITRSLTNKAENTSHKLRPIPPRRLPFPPGRRILIIHPLFAVGVVHPTSLHPHHHHPLSGWSYPCCAHALSKGCAN
jgi:hypothetical protein